MAFSTSEDVWLSRQSRRPSQRRCVSSIRRTQIQGAAYCGGDHPDFDAIAAPAGYAISRYFSGVSASLAGIRQRAFRLRSGRPVTFIECGMFEKVYSVALMHTALTLPTTILVVSSVFASIPRELKGGHGVGERL